MKVLKILDDGINEALDWGANLLKDEHPNFSSRILNRNKEKTNRVIHTAMLVGACVCAAKLFLKDDIKNK